MKKTVICYKMNKPVVYNKGTEWERVEDTFLWGYTKKTIKEKKEEIKKVNKEKPEEMDKRKIDWDKIKEFFVTEQEEMV